MPHTIDIYLRFTFHLPLFSGSTHPKEGFSEQLIFKTCKPKKHFHSEPLRSKIKVMVSSNTSCIHCHEKVIRDPRLLCFCEPPIFIKKGCNTYSGIITINAKYRVSTGTRLMGKLDTHLMISS